MSLIQVCRTTIALSIFVFAAGSTFRCREGDFCIGPYGVGRFMLINDTFICSNCSAGEYWDGREKACMPCVGSFTNIKPNLRSSCKDERLPEPNLLEAKSDKDVPTLPSSARFAEDYIFPYKSSNVTFGEDNHDKIADKIRKNQNTHEYSILSLNTNSKFVNESEISEHNANGLEMFRSTYSSKNKSVKENTEKSGPIVDTRKVSEPFHAKKTKLANGTQITNTSNREKKTKSIAVARNTVVASGMKKTRSVNPTNITSGSTKIDVNGDPLKYVSLSNDKGEKMPKKKLKRRRKSNRKLRKVKKRRKRRRNKGKQKRRKKQKFNDI